jgi:peptide/nickel transport system permease protein
VILTPRRMVGLALIALALACAALADVIAPHDPLRSSVALLSSPSTAHALGTDELGRDVLSRVMHGARTSLLIGFGAAVLAMTIGAPVGLLAGYIGGRLDVVTVVLIDLFVALPGLVLALVITVMVGPSLPNLALVLGFVMWPSVARLIRGQVLAIREATFIEAARAVGGTTAWIISRHVWPNTMRVVAAQFAVSVSFAIFTSSSLSFLGLGIPPPTPDWGGMVRAGYDFLAINPLMSLGPGAAVAVTVLGFYLVGSSVE